MKALQLCQPHQLLERSRPPAKPLPSTVRNLNFLQSRLKSSISTKVACLAGAGAFIESRGFGCSLKPGARNSRICWAQYQTQEPHLMQSTFRSCPFSSNSLCTSNCMGQTRVHWPHFKHASGSTSVTIGSHLLEFLPNTTWCTQCTAICMVPIGQT